MVHGLDPVDLIVRRHSADTDDIILSFAGTDDQIVLVNNLTSNNQDQIEQVIFDDNTTLSRTDIVAKILEPTAADDVIIGTSANETLTGAAGNDTFAFGSGWGNDTVSDFDSSGETLDLTATGLSFAELTISQDGINTLVEDTSGNSILLSGVDQVDIDQTDFTF